MYRTCIFCHASLGTNETIEAFPVGRRLAFDAAKGRLWVVCAKCHQWNLTPLEERWEAVEECERSYRGTRARSSTDEIGLARLPGGLEIIRIGRPLRPEFAAWRYGRQLARRRDVVVATAGLTLVGTAALFGGAALAALIVIPAWWLHSEGVPRLVKDRRIVARVPAGQHHHFLVRAGDLPGAQLVRTSDDSWALDLFYDGGYRRYAAPAAIRVMSHLMAGVNRFGGTRRHISRAVDLLEDAGDPARLFLRVAQRSEEVGPLSVAQLSSPVRLAIEMSAHEESERRALEGELAELRLAWEAAETVAAIADDMFLPRELHDFIARHRRR